MKTKLFLIITAVVIYGIMPGFYFIPSSFQDPVNNLPIDLILSDSSNGDVYACPMHPEITSDKPGTCPKCGMDLEQQKKEDNEQSSIYTCPMHPEVTSDKPGTCSKCGMDLIKKDDETKDKGMMKHHHKHHMKHN